MSSLLNKLKLVGWLFTGASLVALVLGFYFLYRRQEEILKRLDLLPEQEVFEEVDSTSEIIDKCGDECKAEIAKEVSEAISSISATTTEKIVERQTVVSEPSGTDFIPMGSTATTTEMDWTDVDDSAVYIDIENDYGKDATISWEAFLKVAHGNGRAFARLYDDTNKIAVDFSEISTENNASYTQVSSGNLPFWRGRNLYKVQIKSLNSFEVTYSGGKIKVSY